MHQFSNKAIFQNLFNLSFTWARDIVVHRRVYVEKKNVSFSIFSPISAPPLGRAILSLNQILSSVLTSNAGMHENSRGALLKSQTTIYVLETSELKKNPVP